MKGILWRQILVFLLLLVGFNYLFRNLHPSPQESLLDIPYSRFKQELTQDNISQVTFQGDKLTGRFKSPPSTGTGQLPAGEAQTREFSGFRTRMPPVADAGLLPELEKRDVKIEAIESENPSFWTNILIALIPWVLIIGVWWYILRRMREKGPGGGMLGSFGKSGAKLFSQEQSQVSFEDVAGLEEAKQELMEVVEFLRNPQKFTRIGGKVPRGILLVGPPGTGKTLMARAVAGEAGVPFFSIAASQFIEMFVGVGASRVRDLFSNAKKSAPSIIFIDELDAVGRARGTGLGGGNDEREQTLNQLLAELDGFDPHAEVVVMSATNRPDVLDSALLRPGRFDRQVVVERPDWRAREEILKVHTRNKPLAEDVELRTLAKGTPGMCGADLENVVNEAALIAARHDQEKIAMANLEEAKDRILMGAERKLVLSREEKRITAFHEAGHALVARLMPGSDPVHKVSIIPRGQALGVTQQLPLDDRYHYPRSYLMTRITVSLGGRAAEKLTFEEVSTGAQNDLRQATDIAEKMVCQWGMSEKVGPVAFNRGEEHPFLGRRLATDKTYSEQMAWLIDQEIETLLKDAEAKAEQIVTGHRDALEALAEALLEEETLDGRQVDQILQPFSGGAPQNKTAQAKEG